MSSLHKLEATAAGWYKNVPHLPKEFTKWLADNAWWLVLIGVVLSVLALFTIVPAALFAFGLSTSLTATYGAYVSPVYTQSLFGLLWLSTLVSLVGLVVTTILEILAINPLKVKLKKGWTLLFIVLLVNLAISIVANLVAFTFFGIVWTIIWAAVAGYFMFEVRDHFDGKHKAEHKKA